MMFPVPAPIQNKKSDQRCHDGDLPRMSLDHPGGDRDHPVNATGRLHHRSGSDHSQDDQHRRPWRVTRRLLEHEHENGNTKAAPQADADAASPGAHDDRPQDDQRLQHEYQCIHVTPPFDGADPSSGSRAFLSAASCSAARLCFTSVSDS